jgi:hypothetical protein
MKNFYFILALSIFANATAFATPAQVILIRHAEKPPTGPDLNDRGYQRANALVGFFLNNPAMTEFGTPVAIYAMAVKTGAAQDGSALESSKRPIETVTPLAQKLGLTIHDNFAKTDVDATVADIMNNPAYDGHMVLICWEHNMIPLFAQAFGAKTAPTSWDDTVFDRAWVITFSGASVTSFQNLPQHLLPGDSEN